VRLSNGGGSMFKWVKNLKYQSFPTHTQTHTHTHTYTHCSGWISSESQRTREEKFPSEIFSMTFLLYFQKIYIQYNILYEYIQYLTMKERNSR